MQQQILDALKPKFEGVSENILSRVAKKLAETVTKPEDVAAAVAGVTFQQVLESYGDSRATDATKTAVLNYEKKYGIKDGKAVITEPEPEPKKQTEGGADPIPDWAKALIDSNKQLSERLRQIDTERTTASRKQQLADVLNQLPELQRKGYERISYADLKDDEFDTLLSEIKTEVGELSKATAARGVVFGKPTSIGTTVTSTTPEASSEEVAAVLDHLNI